MEEQEHPPYLSRMGMQRNSEILEADYVIIGAGLAGLCAASDLISAGKSVIVLERDKPENVGGLARKSFGGILYVGSPEQKRMRIRDNPDLALKDWLSFARFGENDILPRRWAETYVNRNMEIIYPWLQQRKVKYLPIVNWPERGLYVPGNSLPRWHITWGTGIEIIRRVMAELEANPHRDKLKILFRHNVQSLVFKGGSVCGCEGIVEPGNGSFRATGGAVLIAAGGICGGDLSMVRKNWPKALGKIPAKLLNGSHLYADGRMHTAAAKAGAAVTHLNWQWHYAAGITHPNPSKPNDGLSLVPPRSALWLNARGERIGPMPLVGYTDTGYLVEQICHQPGQYSWQLMNRKIALKELAVSGSDYMTAFVKKSKLLLLKSLLFGNRDLIDRLIRESEDLVVAESLEKLVEKMNTVERRYTVDLGSVREAVEDYDGQIDRGEKYFNDEQLRRIMNFRTYRGDRIRTCKYQKISDTRAMPFIAIRETILTRKSLGGIQTDLASRVMDRRGRTIPGLYAAGEAAGFGGGGIHGQGSLEGTFLGSCILTGRLAAASMNGRVL